MKKKTNNKSKAIIVYDSFHHGNTEKIARAIGSVLKARVVRYDETNIKEILKYNLIGFGSGIYYSTFSRKMIRLASSLPNMKGKKAFVFSTAGIRPNVIMNRGNKSMKKIMQKKNFDIIGEFHCLGFDTYGLLRLFNGINKGKPDKKDIENARRFAKSLL